MSRESKLVELRSKTDRGLLILVRRELDRGMALANVATGKGSPLYSKAESTYSSVKLLLPKLGAISPDERRELEVELKDLRATLDGLPRDYTGAWLEHDSAFESSLVSSCLEKQNVVAFRIMEHRPLTFRANELIFADSSYRSLEIRNLKEQDGLIGGRVWLRTLLFQTDEVGACVELGVMARFFIRYVETKRSPVELLGTF